MIQTVQLKLRDPCLFVGSTFTPMLSLSPGPTGKRIHQRLQGLYKLLVLGANQGLAQHFHCRPFPVSLVVCLFFWVILAVV